MKKDCLNIGTIQAFLDGELASDLLENVSHHIALCEDCAMQLATAEEESAIAFTALDAELNTLVPTQRLWAKINDSIEREKKPFWQTAFAFFKNPTIAAFASLMIVFGIFMAYMNSQADQTNTLIAETKSTVQQDFTPISSNSDKSVSTDETQKTSDETQISPTEKPRNEFRAVKANFRENIRKTNNKPKVITDAQPIVYQYLPGEDSYIKTIATLEKTVNVTKDEALNPSARFTYEQNLAVVNDAITKMRTEVKKNPRNESARQILMSSYQNKVDLLNSVAEKNQLMASMQ